MKLTGCVMAHPRRAERARKLVSGNEQRLRLALDPDPDGPPSAFRTSMLAWSSIPEGATHHVVLHDDMELSPGFWQVADHAVRALPDAALAFFAFWNSRNAGAVRLGTLAGVRWVRAANEYTPCAALALPREVAAGYVSSVRDKSRTWPDDVLMHRYLRSTGVPVYLAVPNQAQHEELHSLTDNDFQGPRRSACFAGPGIRDDLDTVDRIDDLPVIPFFKHGVAQCAVRIPETCPPRWENVECERYLRRIGLDVEDVRRRTEAAGRRLGSPSAHLPDGTPHAAAAGSVWLTAYAMGVVCRTTKGFPAGAEPSSTRRRGDVDAALRTIGAGGLCDKLDATAIGELTEPLTDLAWDGLTEGMDDGTRLGAGRAEPLGTATPGAARVVVTGGNGFPGSYVARYLADRRHRVVSVDLAPPAGRYPDIDYAAADLGSPRALGAVCAGARAIVHLAGTGATDAAVAGAARTAGVARVIRLEPDGPPAGRPTAESTPDTITIRVGEVYGPGAGPSGLVARFVGQAYLQGSLGTDEPAGRVVRLSHVADLARTIDEVLTGDHVPDPLVPLGEIRLTVAELADLVCRAVRPVPIVLSDGRAGQPADRGAPPLGEHSRDEPVDPEYGVRTYAQWLAYDSDG